MSSMTCCPVAWPSVVSGRSPPPFQLRVELRKTEGIQSAHSIILTCGSWNKGIRGRIQVKLPDLAWILSSKIIVNRLEDNSPKLYIKYMGRLSGSVA